MNSSKRAINRIEKHLKDYKDIIKRIDERGTINKGFYPSLKEILNFNF